MLDLGGRLATVFGRLAKAAALRTPVGRRVVAERAESARRVSEACAQRDEVRAQLDKITVKLKELASERDAIARERDALKTIRDVLQEERDEVQSKLLKYGDGPPFVPNGHFYSPIPSPTEVQRDEKRIFSAWPRTLPDIDLRESEQIALLRKIAGFYPDLPFKADRVDGLRYHYNNTAYGCSDAIFLNGMLRHIKPRRVIEIGSGHSSCMTLDTNDLWLGGHVECTFVEPYPQLLNSLLKDGDAERINVLPHRVQDVDPDVFAELEAGDVLFIDSTHVGKTGSDVNHLFFEVLPSIAAGVYVHVHDIFYPFEYPRTWVEQGIAWNEQYMLRTFLQNNHNYEIVLFNTFLTHFHEEFFKDRMPLCLKNPGGSIWLRKVGK